LKDIAIIGAGPAGLHAARRLADAGLDVGVLDAQNQIGEHAICSGVIGAEAFKRFGFTDQAVLNTIRCIRAISPSAKKLEHRSATPLAYVVDKAGFNRHLADLAVTAGAELMLGRWVESIECGKHAVSLRFRSREGDCSAIRARAALLASGVNASLSKGLGLARPLEFLSAMQADIRLGTDGAARPTEVFVGRAVAPGAFGWKIPLGNGLVRVGLMSDRDPQAHFNALLKRIAPEALSQEIAVVRKAIGQMPVGECAAERVLVIGEAAGHVKTSTGGGIYYGLLSAELACEVILRGFRKCRLGKEALSEFDRSWRAQFGGELVTGYWARKLLGRLPDDLLEKIFDWANAADLVPRLNGKMKFDWHQKAILTTVRNLLSLPASS
jgi:digeranylgeranylglycerophospholipid reductase